MDIVIKLSQFLLSLSLLIILHELGHFIPAKAFKTRVEKFYLFFDVKFSLLKKKIGETEYGIGWLPLGGYVKISGMIDESMDTEQMALPPQPWEFRSKPAWQRLIIMLGGVTVNFILAFVIYIGMTWYYGDSYIANDSLKDGIWVLSKGLEEAGLKSGDKIIAIDNEKLDRFDQAQGKILTAKTITVNRNGADKEIALPVDLANKIIQEKQKVLFFARIPFIAGGFDDASLNKNTLKAGDFIVSVNNQKIKYYDEAPAIIKQYANKSVSAVIKRNDKEQTVTLKINNKGQIGVAPAMISTKDGEKMGLFKLITTSHTLVESIPIGFQMGIDKLSDYGKQLKLIANPDTGAYKGVGGFAAIYNVFPEYWSWEVFWSITAFLSIMLGVMNLLPIPALDGGHVMFLLYEIVSGKKPSDKFLENAQMVGFVLLISLLLFANGNDIYKAIVGK